MSCMFKFYLINLKTFTEKKINLIFLFEEYLQFDNNFIS